jgi:hypothetical protein
MPLSDPHFAKLPPGPNRRLVVTGLAGVVLEGVFGGPPNPAIAQVVAVDLALVLAVDCSWSVDANEFRLQMHGLAEAFRRPEIHRAIADGPLGRIAAVVVQWSGDLDQVTAVPWTLVADDGDAIEFARVLAATPRDVAEGATATGAAMQYSAALLHTVPVAATRKVIDISSDGRSNRGVRPGVVRDRIAAQGITINGLVILDEWPTLDIYFAQQVVGGPAHFVIAAHDYDAYAEAIYRKLMQEISGPGVS